MAIRRDARAALGFTQETLAHELGVELSTVGRWERGTLMPQPWRRLDLAKALKLSLEELDRLLTPSPIDVGDSLATRREVMVDAALLTPVIMADQVVRIHGENPLLGACQEPSDRRITITSASALVRDTHRTYQAAQYGDVARRLPSVTAAVDALVAQGSANERRQAFGLQCSVAVVAAKLVTKAGDAGAGWRAAEQAGDLAQLLCVDRNIGWTAFGPTNVLIHRVSVAVALHDPNGALATAEQLDITALPVGLNGRQAQFHLDSAWAHTQLGQDPQAVIHLLDTERVAPELVRANPNARALIRELLSRERRRAVPGLRGLALRAGIAA